MIISIYKNLVSPFLSLLTSVSTLICCALPALLVSIGMGATIVSLTSVFPWIIIISKYKIYIFIFAGLTLLISSYIFWLKRNSPCPVDPKQAKICIKLRSFNFVILSISITIYLIGFFFAFIANKIFY